MDAPSLPAACATAFAVVATIFLGVTIGATMSGPTFLHPRTIDILVLGCLAFVFSTAGGILFAKALNLVLLAGVIGTAVAAGVFLALLR